MNENSLFSNIKCYICGSDNVSRVVHINKKPVRETEFGIPKNYYHRWICRCNFCSVYLNIHHMLDENLYENSYNVATYQRNLLEIYQRIRCLPAERSDNKRRVSRIDCFSKQLNHLPAQTNVLDIGSGLCVFLGELKEYGYKCFCIDPDHASVQHALDNVKIDGAFVGTLDTYKTEMKFEIITLNKVLEHMINPVQTLKTAKNFLAKGGFIYIELPDGDAAYKHGGAIDREEFYVEHFTVFTEKSFSKLAELANLRCLKMEAIHEPSDKYTLYAFLSESK